MNKVFEKFDRVVCINLVERKDRREFIESQMNSLGIDSNEIIFHESVKHPFGEWLVRGFNLVSKAESKNERGFFTLPNEISCLREHYTVIKKAYLQNVENLLVIEDDICFNKDITFLKRFLEAIPEDFDILQGDGFTVDKRLSALMTDECKWTKHPGIGVWNASFIALSRKGMKYYIDFIDNFYSVADMPYYKSVGFADLNAYISSQPIVIQESRDVLESDLRGFERETSEMNIYYSKIDRQNYFTKDII